MSQRRVPRAERQLGLADAPAMETGTVPALPSAISVAQLTEGIKRAIEPRFADVWVEGEISNYRGPHRSGHAYFALKDADAVISVVLFRREMAAVKFRLEEGMAVLAHGRVSLYAPRGNYQLILDRVEPQGVGALMAAFEQLKAKLEREGLFSVERKRPLPRLPRKIGIVTSASGAALRDLLKVLQQRAPQQPILVCPAQVQGPGSGDEVATAISKLGQTPLVDVIIAGRGGGSIEDLWAFNEEKVARAIAASPVPVVSAVGHEVDFTIADFVADVRAATPSHAAELVVPVMAELQDALRATQSRLARAVRSKLGEDRARLMRLQARLSDPGRALAQGRLRLDDLETRLLDALRRPVQSRRRNLHGLSERLGRNDPRLALGRARGRLDKLEGRLRQALRSELEKHRQRMAIATEALAARSPLSILSRGYALATRMEGGELLRDARRISPGDRIELRLHTGRVRAEVTETLPPDTLDLGSS